MSYYLFVDGEYLRKAHEKTMSAFFGSVPAVDHRRLVTLGANHQRVFYYDAIDYEPRSDEMADQTQARIDTRIALHRQINGISNFHVRDGYVPTHEVVLSGHGTADSLASPYELFVDGGDESNSQSLGVRLDTPDAGHRRAQAFELGYGGEIKWR